MEDYRWNSIGYHVQTNNRDNFLSTDFGPGEIHSAVTSELHWAGVLDTKERLKRYRRYVYEAGALDRSDKGTARVIDRDIVEHERGKNYEIRRADRFRYRTRYFTDSGVIGSKEFVSKTYMRFKHHFNSKNEKKPKPVKGLSGVYSLKRLSKISWKIQPKIRLTVLC